VEAKVSDATMTQASMAETTAHAAESSRTADPRREDKLALSGSVMLIVLGSGSCWFLLTALARWMFF
jgi:hypothetical protein